ncbi:AMP-binding protein [Yinghuangia soli]|uniref:AMP-binding protein n=1 Tax=Yinghuangia soli TaxID=2908204 RepID=A0AA41Q8H7_9ACTN|nr:AMP-binding protein [Yinghuangia soli]MCF2533553.1 AMP-binding protein [Yinghuangia soli]
MPDAQDSPAVPPPPRTPFGVRLAELAAEAPDRPALTDHERTVTRAELESRTNRLARAYAALGVGEGSYVTIGLPNGVEFLEAAVAAWKLGATPQPLSYRLPPRELNAVLDLVKPALVVGIPGAEGATTVPRGFVPGPEHSDAPLPAAIAPSFKAPTSGGSSGTPKVILSADEAIAENVLPLGALVRLEPGSVQLTTGPLSHNGPFLVSTVGLLNGTHNILMPRFDAATALDLVARHGVEWMYTVPTMLHRFAKLPAEERDAADLGSLRTVLTLAALCPQWLKEFCVGWLGADRMLEVYAATEAHAITLIDGHGWMAKPGSVGQVVAGEIEVRDPEGRKLPAGEIGELWMRRGPDGATTYRYIGARPRAAGDGWESVGDLGSIDADGFLHLADRSDDMFVVGGANVYPAEVEGALDEHPAVLSSCVLGLPDEEYGSVVHAIVQTDGDLTDEELLDHLRERLVAYKLPRSIERSSEPLRDDAGKVRRSRLRADRIAARAASEAGTG